MLCIIIDSSYYYKTENIQWITAFVLMTLFSTPKRVAMNDITIKFKFSSMALIGTGVILGGLLWNSVFITSGFTDFDFTLFPLIAVTIVGATVIDSSWKKALVKAVKENCILTVTILIIINTYIFYALPLSNKFLLT